MKSCDPTPAHVAFMEELKDTLARHQHLSAQEMLAVSAQFCGNLIALQDQTRFTPQIVMELVARNIEMGNRAAIEAFIGDVKGHA